jgi:anti-sigma factor ChrR (cupin superfamily)
LNDDMNQRVVLHTATMPWVPSPMAGVDRRMLDRVGDEVARATSIVRYAAGSRFSPHLHGGGEEFLVLEGVFSDEHGDYPAGSYLRNPPGTSHAPHSVPGCTIFVKLWQFAAGDTTPVSIDSRSAAWHRGAFTGLDVLPLHAHGGVDTVLERWEPAARAAERMHPGGAEILVLEGSLHDEHGDYPALSWLRMPRECRHTLRTGPSGALALVKTGHIGVEWLALPGAPAGGR